MTRLVLDYKSECVAPTLELPGHELGKYSIGCWYPKTFDKAIIILVDALRYDFTVPSIAESHHYHDALTVLHEVARGSPENAFLLPFIADPPTTTLQRLKGLTTGTLPTFIDAGSNFAGTSIDEDNLLSQLRDAGKNIVHLGDDTWHALFPDYFDPNLTHAYDSFNVWDLHTVDNGVNEHIFPLLNPANSPKWDIIIGHYLGVDHAGHRYGPDHPATAAKLRQMDQVFRNITSEMDDETLLVIMGDHGMDSKGDHGGESDDEIEAALWMYSRKGVFGRSQSDFVDPPSTAKERPVWQIDLVPTLSLLLGVPIPFNNLGTPIEEAFIGHDGQDWQKMASVNALTAAQIKKYQHEYASARGLDSAVFANPASLWNTAMHLWDIAISTGKEDILAFKIASDAFRSYESENLNICKSLWARFDIPSMIYGIAILVAGVICLGLFARSDVAYEPSRGRLALKSIAIGTCVGAVFGSGCTLIIHFSSMLDGALLGAAFGGLGNFATLPRSLFRNLWSILPATFWGWLAFVFTISQSIGFASNSYTIWEDEILLFFTGTFGLLTTISSCRQAEPTDRILGMYQSLLFLILTRTASLSRLCREEQMPFCRSTYYASANSSISAPWQLLLPYILALLLPSIIKSYYKSTRSYEGSAVTWIGFALRLGLFGSAIFWTLDAADDGEWFSLDRDVLKTIKSSIAQIVLAIAFAAGLTTFIWADPCVHIEVFAAGGDGQSKTGTPTPKQVKVLGYANAHGSRFFLLFSSWLLAIILVQKPMGGGSIGVLTWQILALLDIIDTNSLSASAIGPIILGMLGNFYFFKTGHQATLSSIQWESAFIPLKTIQYPWSPILLMLNAFGAQILTAIAVPLVVLWKQPPKKPGLLIDVAKAMATHMLFYAVINVATTMWAGWLRRHLMLYRIFSPRFLTGAAVLLVVDVVGTFVAVGGLRWNTPSVAGTFGWD